jgi:hypothetical protein
MNWKNKTYFQGNDARPFAQSADGSRASSGKGGQGSGFWRAIRRFFGWLFLLVLVFGAGLTVGLVEDYEAEGYVQQAKASLGLKESSSNDSEWMRLWKSGERVQTRHFGCRMDCRRVTMDEVESAVRNGELVDYVPSECLENGAYAGSKYTVQGFSNTGRLLSVVFATSGFYSVVKLITVWEVGKDFDCPDEC